MPIITMPIAQMELNGASWGTLLGPLIDLILAHLSILNLFSMRLVCKQWNNLIHSIGFVKNQVEVTFELSYYVLYRMEDHRVQIGPAF